MWCTTWFIITKNKVDKAIYSSVVPSVDNTLLKACFNVTGFKPISASESLVNKAKEKANVEFIKNEIIGVNGEDFVTSVTLRDNTKLEVSALFPYLGFKSATDFLLGLGIKMDKGYIITDMSMASNVDGIYAVGDVRKKELRQLVTAANDGAIAALAIVKYLNK